MRSALAIAAVVLLAGCSTSPGPSAPVSSAAGSPAAAESGAAAPSEPVDFLVQQLTGPWRRSPIILDERHIAIISDACAAAAREKLGEVEANLPTAVVDARGEHFVTAILADDLNAVECLARVDDTGETATVDSIDRLAISAVKPVADTAISVASVVHASDLTGGRTIAFGRVGLKAEAAKVAFDDASVILATDSQGWWAMWWRGTVRAAGYSAVDTSDIVIGSAKPFAGEREARVGPAWWWLEPVGVAPKPDARTIRGSIIERECAGDLTPEGRIEPPTIEIDDQSIVVTFWVRWAPTRECKGAFPPNNPFPVTLELPEKVGNRVLYDGSEQPPRDASKGPPG